MTVRLRIAGNGGKKVGTWTEMTTWIFSQMFWKLVLTSNMNTQCETTIHSCSSSSLQIAGEQVRQIFKPETNIASHVFVLSLQVVDIQGQQMEYTEVSVCTH